MIHYNSCSIKYIIAYWTEKIINLIEYEYSISPVYYKVYDSILNREDNCFVWIWMSFAAFYTQTPRSFEQHFVFID